MEPDCALVKLRPAARLNMFEMNETHSEVPLEASAFGPYRSGYGGLPGSECCVPTGSRS